jgi:hypothetical protein
MPNRTNHILVMVALMLVGSTLSGCSTINEKMAAGVGDYLPKWAGGLPADAPPRQGTPEYDAWMKERERKRLLPAAERGDTPQQQGSPSAITSQNATQQNTSQQNAAH